MTKQQERARARRRYEKQQAGLSRQAADRARLSHLGTILGTVLVVVLVLAAERDKVIEELVGVFRR